MSGGDLRSIGARDRVVALIRKDSPRIEEAVECLFDVDAPVRMRAADALEQISRVSTLGLQRFKPVLLQLLEEATQKEMRWRLALIVPRLKLTQNECRRAANALEQYLDDASSLVKTFAMQGLFDLAHQNTALEPGVTETITALTRSGTPAMRARGRNLLKAMERERLRPAAQKPKHERTKQA